MFCSQHLSVLGVPTKPRLESRVVTFNPVFIYAWFFRQHAIVNGSPTAKDLAEKVSLVASAVEEGAWMILATTTTVGYGDAIPRTGVSRMLTSLWMFGGFVASASVIGGITTALSAPAKAVQQADITALKNNRVCTHEGYIKEIRKYLVRPWPEEGITSSDATVVDACLDYLKQGKVSAVIYDTPVLRAARIEIDWLKSYTISNSFMQFELYPVVHENNLIARELNYGQYPSPI